MTDHNWKPTRRIVYVIDTPDQRWGFMVTPHGLLNIDYKVYSPAHTWLILDFVYGGRHLRRSLEGTFTSYQISREAWRFVNEIVSQE